MFKTTTTTKSAISLYCFSQPFRRGKSKIYLHFDNQRISAQLYSIVALKVSSCRIPLVISSSFLFVFLFNQLSTLLNHFKKIKKEKKH